MFAKIMKSAITMAETLLLRFHDFSLWQAVLIHEYGHYLGCILTKTKVVYVVVGNSNFLTPDKTLNEFAHRTHITQKKKHFIASPKGYATIKHNGGIVHHRHTTPFKNILITFMGPFVNITTSILLFFITVWLLNFLREVPILFAPLVVGVYIIAMLLLIEHMRTAIRSLLDSDGTSIKKHYKEWRKKRQKKTRT